jgi:hypothetical protein
VAAHLLLDVLDCGLENTGALDEQCYPDRKLIIAEEGTSLNDFARILGVLVS